MGLQVGRRGKEEEQKVLIYLGFQEAGDTAELAFYLAMRVMFVMTVLANPQGRKGTKVQILSSP